MSTSSREQVCRTVSRKLAAAVPGLPGVRALIGLDGFVDEIIAVVDKRRSHDAFEPVRTIDALGRKISAAAGQSSNYELVVRQHKLGGNGPIMADALAKAGANVTYVGALGYPQVHPVFADFAADATVVSICDAGHTDALEFEDGKLMLGKYVQLADANWSNLVSRVGRDRLVAATDAAALVAMNNWTMLPFMTQVWEGFEREVLPAVSRRPRTFFADLADPEKRTPDDLRAALAVLTRIQRHADVVLGLNLKESAQVAAVLGVDVPGTAADAADAEPRMVQAARAIRERMDVGCVVVHRRRGAAAATRDDAAQFVGPFVHRPAISTGAGDHFNAGFCLGRAIGLTLEECLCAGCATSGHYVRTGRSPSAEALAAFVAELPTPEG